MSDTLTIKCNNVPRDTLYWYELTAREQKEFDYLDTDDKQAEATFFRYKGIVYDLGEFMRIGRSIAPHCQRPGWETFDGYASDSYFSGILVRYVQDCERVVVATYYS
jgi:hypothetical protein